MSEVNEFMFLLAHTLHKLDRIKVFSNEFIKWNTIKLYIFVSERQFPIIESLHINF